MLRLHLSRSGTGEIKLWDLESRRAQISFTAHSSSSILQTTHLDESRLLSQAKDGRVSIWDISRLDSQNRDEKDKKSSKNVPIFSLETGAYGFCRCSHLNVVEDKKGSGRTNITSNNLLVTSSPHQSKLLLWDLNARKPVMKIDLGHGTSTSKSGASGSLKLGMCNYASLWAMPVTGERVVTWAAEGGHIGFFSLRSKTNIAKGTLEKQPIMCANALYSKKIGKKGGALGFAGSADGGISAFSANFEKGTIDLHKRLKVSSRGFSEISIRNDRRVFAAAGWDHRLRVFNCKTLEPIAILKYHTESVFSTSFSSAKDGLLASGSKDKSIAVYSLLKMK